ncbi:MAG: FAD-binding oxidoreductase [Pseudonocardia sp.]|nr:FAD-binding oxidoreductase [Pseudonocardia sp.]
MRTPDVVVIGGGIAGASIAYELAAHRRVVLLEAESALATHTTGRSAATWIPGHGTAVFRALITASGPRFAALADELGAAPFLTTRGTLWAAFDDEGEAALEAMLREQAGEPDAPLALGAAETGRACPVLRAPRAGAIAEGGADVDVMGLHQAFVRGLRRRGGEIRTNARVAAVEPVGELWRVRTTGGEELTAPDVVDAAGAWADVVAGLAGVPALGLQPYRRTIAIAPVPEPTGPLPMVCEATERFYFKNEDPAGAMLLLSPADETPSEPGDPRPEELDVALGLERVEEATGLGLRSVRTAWAGLRTFAPGRGPVVGARPEHPGFHFFAGQGGSGVESSPALAALGAAIVTGTPVPADIPVTPGQVAPGQVSASH